MRMGPQILLHDGVTVHNSGGIALSGVGGPWDYVSVTREKHELVWPKIAQREPLDPLLTAISRNLVCPKYPSGRAGRVGEAGDSQQRAFHTDDAASIF